MIKQVINDSTYIISHLYFLRLRIKRNKLFNFANFSYIPMTLDNTLKISTDTVNACFSVFFDEGDDGLMKITAAQESSLKSSFLLH